MLSQFVQLSRRHVGSGVAFRFTIAAFQNCPPVGVTPNLAHADDHRSLKHLNDDLDNVLNDYFALHSGALQLTGTRKAKSRYG